MKLTKPEYDVLSDCIERRFDEKNEYEVFPKQFEWFKEYKCAGIGSFENSRNCSQANTIYKYCNIEDESKFRRFLIDWIWEYKVAVDNNTTIITEELTKPEFKVGYDNLESILSKFDEHKLLN